ncbi:cell division protein ZapA [Herbaspirillum sp. meg3]|jgi:cell division protein ZapA|uniref:Cell division protein ZapA n=1 Tax=Herbaspirillum rhizosphaerae TaxID=346179 RepID=A0ABW8Z681_9BURK|nr:cell division protein ZapA [Herbaspirillum sp. meg3]ASU40009.1 cell division protein ZapA [Herbaspirillum sp. meg3]
MIQLNVTIMGHSYTLACKEGEEATLQQAVAYLDEKMCVIRDSGKIKGNDRIAVMAALGIAAELLSTQPGDGPFAGMTVAEWKQSIAAMHTVLDEALTPQENLF